MRLRVHYFKTVSILCKNVVISFHNPKNAEIKLKVRFHIWVIIESVRLNSNLCENV